MGRCPSRFSAISVQSRMHMQRSSCKLRQARKCQPVLRSPKNVPKMHWLLCNHTGVHRTTWSRLACVAAFELNCADQPTAQKGPNFKRACARSSIYPRRQAACSQARERTRSVHNPHAALYADLSARHLAALVTSDSPHSSPMMSVPTSRTPYTPTPLPLHALLNLLAEESPQSSTMMSVSTLRTPCAPTPCTACLVGRRGGSEARR